MDNAMLCKMNDFYVLTSIPLFYTLAFIDYQEKIVLSFLNWKYKAIFKKVVTKGSDEK